MKFIIWLIILATLIFGGYYLINNNINLAEKMDNSEVSEDEMVKEVDGVMQKEMMEMEFSYSGVLEDVTGGEDVRGINTQGVSSGIARANFADREYSLLVTFENLPQPVGTDFYEGWIVRKGLKFDVISTGRVERIDGVYTNVYSSGQDLTDHDFYVLTLEPDDGDPAPADHIVEGTLEI